MIELWIEILPTSSLGAFPTSTATHDFRLLCEQSYIGETTLFTKTVRNKRHFIILDGLLCWGIIHYNPIQYHIIKPHMNPIHWGRLWMSIPSKAAAQLQPSSTTIVAGSQWLHWDVSGVSCCLRVSRASREFQSKKGCLQIGANKTPLVCNWMISDLSDLCNPKGSIMYNPMNSYTQK